MLCFKADFNSEILGLNNNNSGKSQLSHSPPHSIKQNVKLPVISIPTFSEQISQWTSFIEIFNALILNYSSLSKIEKFMYLKSYLKGEALKIIEGVELTNDNFDVALK